MPTLKPFELDSQTLLSLLKTQLGLATDYKRVSQTNGDHLYSNTMYHVDLILSNDKASRKLNKIVVDATSGDEANIAKVTETVACVMKQLDPMFAANPNKCVEVMTEMLRRVEQGKPTQDINSEVNGICYNLKIIRDRSLSVFITRC